MTGHKPMTPQNINDQDMPARRLIEEWLPIAEIGEESARERRSMTALPPTYYLHVWWARRPLVASRAAILGALLPENADREKFMHVLGIHGDPVATRKKIEFAKKKIDPKTGKRENLGLNPYGYERAFKFLPSKMDLHSIFDQSLKTRILDPTAGGGSIPFEAIRLGQMAIVNELNPVAWLILKATVNFPSTFGAALIKRFRELSQIFMEKAEPRFEGIFPKESDNIVVDAYLWTRTISCPYCGGEIPLSPNWRINNKGMGVRLIPETSDPENRRIRFEIVKKLKDQSEGTVNSGKGICPFPDCGRVIEGDEIKDQAQAGKMGEILYAVVYNELEEVGIYKSGKKKGQPKIKKIRGFRAPRPEDDIRQMVAGALEEKMPEWMARGIVPDEQRYIGPADRSANYGLLKMTDLFSPRQLYGHCTSVEVFQDLVEECGGQGDLSDLDKAAFSYIALALDKMLNYNARLVRWHANREVVAGVFDRHDFAFLWSYAEMAPTITGLGYDWAFKQTGKALTELMELMGHDLSSLDEKPGAHKERSLFTEPDRELSPPEITRGSADFIPGLDDASVDLVVMDPPYYDNVMYAELADFFYVWLKRTAGLLFPEQFSDYLTDKDREAVANVAKFKDFSKVSKSGGAKKRATRDYQERMQAIFAECRRVLKKDGLMVLMFTHKATGAWDALSMGLLEAGFEITASWPVNTEAEGSLHIKDKNAAKSTILLVCRPIAQASKDQETTYWEDVEPLVENIVRERVANFQEAGIGGVDLYLSCFGPALQVFSKHWPMQRGRAMQRPEPAKGAQLKLIEDDDWDPYAVRAEDALNAARTAVKNWRLEQLTTLQRQAHLDPVTEFFVLAWDAFRSPQFPADEALKLARVVGLSFDEKLKNKILELKGSNVILWDSSLRFQKGSVGDPHDMGLNALHAAARMGREQNTGVARDYLERMGVLNDPMFKQALETVLNVLPAPQSLDSGKAGPLKGAAADCEALEKLRRLAFAKEIPQPKQWALFDEDGNPAPAADD